MGMDYTVVVSVRHQLGDELHDDSRPDSEAPFAGIEEDFRFVCPNVSPSEEAILQFEHRGARFYNDHPVYINGEALAGGVPAGPRFTAGGDEYPMWSSRSLLIRPGLLKDSDNVLTFRSNIVGIFANYDNFTIDNVVVFFKTRSGSLGGSPEIKDVKG